MNFWKKKTESFDFQITRRCKHCEATFQGKFCNICGEKVLEKEDQTLKNYLLNLLNAYTVIDGKFFNSIRTLLTRPGKITADISEGITVPYMQPISFFFLANFIYFFFPGSQTFNTALYNQLYNLPYSGFVERNVSEYLVKSQLNLSEFSQLYNMNSTSNSKLLLFLFVVYLIPFIVLTNYSKKVNFVKYFHLSLELVTFILIIPAVGISLLIRGISELIIRLGVEWDGVISDGYYSLFLASIILIYIIPAIHRVFNFPWWRSFLGGILLVSILIVVITIYRLTLFLATFYTL